MPTGTYTAPPDKAVGDALTETNWDTHFRGNILFIAQVLDELSEGVVYSQATADASILAAVTEGAPQDVLVFSAFTVVTGFTDFYVEMYSARLEGGPALNLWDGVTDLGRLNSVNQSTGHMHYSKTRITLSAGAHTLKIRGWASGGTDCVVKAGVGSSGTYRPMWAKVTPGYSVG